jgi:hypothetical protein
MARSTLWECVVINFQRDKIVSGAAVKSAPASLTGSVWTMKIVTHNFLAQRRLLGELELLLYYFSKEAHAWHWWKCAPWTSAFLFLPSSLCALGSWRCWIYISWTWAPRRAEKNRVLSRALVLRWPHSALWQLSNFPVLAEKWNNCTKLLSGFYWREQCNSYDFYMVPAAVKHTYIHAGYSKVFCFLYRVKNICRINFQWPFLPCVLL